MSFLDHVVLYMLLFECRGSDAINFQLQLWPCIFMKTPIQHLNNSNKL